MAAAQINVSLSVNGVLTSRQDTFNTVGQLIDGPTLLAAAIAGTLSTRTSTTVGVLTVPAGHGFTTSDFCAIGWIDANGILNTRTYVTITATTATTISFSLGTGQNLPALNYAVTVGKVTSAVFRIDPQVGSIDPQIPVTALAFSVAAANQQAVALIGKASEVVAGTFTNARILNANGAALPQIFWGALGGFSGFPASSVDTIYLAPLSIVAPTVLAQSLFNA